MPGPIPLTHAHPHWDPIPLRPAELACRALGTGSKAHGGGTGVLSCSLGQRRELGHLRQRPGVRGMGCGDWGSQDPRPQGWGGGQEFRGCRTGLGSRRQGRGWGCGQGAVIGAETGSPGSREGSGGLPSRARGEPARPRPPRPPPGPPYPPAPARGRRSPATGGARRGAARGAWRLLRPAGPGRRRRTRLRRPAAAGARAPARGPPGPAAPRRPAPPACRLRGQRLPRGGGGGGRVHVGRPGGGAPPRRGEARGRVRGGGRPPPAPAPDRPQPGLRRPAAPTRSLLRAGLCAPTSQPLSPAQPCPGPRLSPVPREREDKRHGDAPLGPHPTADLGLGVPTPHSTPDPRPCWPGQE